MELREELRIHIHLEDGSYWATVEDFPGVFAAGDTMDELRESLEEGINLYLADNLGNGPKVQLTGFRAEPVEAQASAALVYA